MKKKYGTFSLSTNEYLERSNSDKYKGINGFNVFNFKQGGIGDRNIHIHEKNIKHFSYRNESTKLKEILFEDSLIEKSLILGNDPDISFCIGSNKETIETMEISYHNSSPEDQGILAFYYFKCKSFTISGHIKEINDKRFSNPTGFKGIRIHNPIELENIIINNLKLGFLTLSEISPIFKTFELRNLEIEHLIIKNSDLSNIKFNGLIVGKLTLENVTINDCIFNDVDFKSYDLGKSIEGKVIKNKKIKDNYRQLKHVMDANGNHTEANKFFAKEMEYYGKTLDFLSIRYSRFINPNWWIFFIQLLISNFGNSWIRPILWILIFSNLAIAYENDFVIYGLPNIFTLDWYKYGIDLVQHLTPFTELTKGVDISFMKFFYNLLIIFLVYQFTIAIKRTTKR